MGNNKGTTWRCMIFAVIQISRAFLRCYVAMEKFAGNSNDYKNCAPPGCSYIVFSLTLNHSTAE